MRAKLALTELEARGVTVHATAVDAPQRSGFTFLDDAGERVRLAANVAAGAVTSLQTREFDFHETFLKLTGTAFV